MKTFRFTGVLLEEGWLKDAFVRIDEAGRIQEISAKAGNAENLEFVDAYALPGIPNAHSHAFQYAMAGLAEQHSRGGERDDFWGWREAMYKLALQIDPDQMQAIAAMLYAEMLRHGYTHVAEFHYVHHDPQGNPYDNLAEMGMRLLAAAQSVGMKITLIPIFYQKGGFGLEASPRQRRFLSHDLAAYWDLYEASKKACSYYEEASFAYGIHSMRGVDPPEIIRMSQSLLDEVPLHMHISEQKKEVEDALSYLGMRPVLWLLEHIAVDDRFHLVHATHMTEEETQALAKSQAHVVLCPSTEGNLGDGLFPLQSFIQAGGKWSIGTDSHIGLNPFEELRILDYGQRIHSHRRNVFLREGHGDQGSTGLQMMIQAGKKAMGMNAGAFFRKGQVLDAILIDAKAPLLATTSPKYVNSSLVYASDSSMHLGTLVNGKWVVKSGKHVDMEAIQTRFHAVMKKLANR